MQKNTTKVPAYTRHAITKYKKKFSQLHVSLTPQAYAIFNQKYPQYSFNQYVNETIDMLLKKDSDVCGFGPGDIQSCDIVKKEACIPHEVKDQIMEKFSTFIEKAGKKDECLTQELYLGRSIPGCSLKSLKIASLPLSHR